MARELKTLMALLLGAFFISGCVRIKLPSDLGPRLAEPELSSVIQQLANSHNTVSTWRSLSKVEVYHGDDRSNFRLATLVDGSDRVRLETLPDVGAYSFSVLGISPGREVFLDIPERRAWVAKESGELIKMALRVPLDSSDLIPVLSGAIPKVDLNSRKAGFYRTKSGQQLVFISANGERVWYLDSNTLATLRYERTVRRRKAALVVRYQDFVTVDGKNLANQIILEVPQEELKVTFNHQRIWLDGTIDAEKFNVKVPSGFEVRRLLER